MKKYIKASYEDKFWELHDSSVEVGTALEDIVDDYGLEDAIFPEDGEPTASEEDYRAILDDYSLSTGGEGVVDADVYDVLEELRIALKGTAGVKRADWIDEIEAMRFTLSDGHTYQLVLQDLGTRL